MVWWMDRNQPDEKCNVYDRYDIPEDRIFPTINVMFDFDEVVNNAYDILALLKSGVHIFNIDQTFFNDLSFETIKKAIQDCNELPNVSEHVKRPISLAVTMSVKKPVTIENDVDFIILKDVSNENEVISFKQSNKDSILPVLLWISKSYIEHTIIDLIQVSHGIILDHSLVSDEYCYDIIQLCKMYRKPLFCLKPEIWEDNTDYNGSKRKLFVVASEIVNSGVNGIVVNGGKRSIVHQTKFIRNIVEAMQAGIRAVNYDKEFEKFRKEIKTPQMTPITVAIGASLTALKLPAAAILVLTCSGQSARLVSFCVPSCHVIAITKRESTAKEMHLYKKVIPFLYEDSTVSNWHTECRKRVLFGIELAAKTGLFGDGAKLVVLAPSAEGVGYCDSVQIVTVPYNCNE